MLAEELIPAKPPSSRALQQHFFSLLNSCDHIKKFTEIHTQLIINGLSQKNYIVVKLLSLYVSSGLLRHAHKVFQNLESPSTTVWNQIIRGYARSETPTTSLQFYRCMVAAESEPDGFTYSYLLSACARCGLLREGEQVHGRVLIKGYGLNMFVQTNLINLYSKGGGDIGGIRKARLLFDDMCVRSLVSWNSLLSGYVGVGDFDSARKLFDEMPDRNVVSWTTMISGCAQNGMSRQALSLLAEMRRNKVELDKVALLAALSACAELGDLKLGRWIHRYIEGRLSVRNKPPSVSLGNALIHMYASCGLIEEAFQVFNKMPQKSTVSWTSIITALAKQGRGAEALAIFQKMLSLGVNSVRPDEITLLGVLSACSHAGLVHEGCRIFNFMNQTWGIKPRIEHYGCMVDLLSRAGFLNEAHELIETMPMKPNKAIWGALLGGCRKHKKANLASSTSQELIAELNPDQAAGYLVLLANVYAMANRWRDVIAVRQRMVEMGVKKPPGRSWIQINGYVHNFLAGDITHKDSSFIYEILCNLTRQAHEEGYEPDLRQLLISDEEAWEEKVVKGKNVSNLLLLK